MSKTYLKKLFYNLIINFILFILMIIIVQNSLEKKKVNFLNFDTIPLPLSFIIGSSFLAGSVIGNMISTIQITKKD